MEGSYTKEGLSLDSFIVVEFYMMNVHAMAPIERTIETHSVAGQDSLRHVNGHMMLMVELNDLGKIQVETTTSFSRQKLEMSRAKGKFPEGRSIWETIIPLGIKDPNVWKWSLAWKGPYRVGKAIDGYLYWLMHIDEIEYIREIDGKHLKPFKSPTLSQEVLEDKNVIVS